MFPVAYGWMKGICRGVRLGVFIGARVAVARPRHGTWPLLRGALFYAFGTSIGHAWYIDAHGGAGVCRRGRSSPAFGRRGHGPVSLAEDFVKHEFE